MPLGEEREAYLLRIMQGVQIKREIMLDQPGWTYTGADQQADGALAGKHLEVAQISAIYGPGAWARLVF